MTDDFYRGVAAALTILAQADQQSFFDEIVSECGREDLIRVARKDRVMRLSGFVQYGYHRRQQVTR